MNLVLETIIISNPNMGGGHFFLICSIRDGGDTPDLKKTFEMFYPEQYQLEEGEERKYMDPMSKQVCTSK